MESSLAPYEEKVVETLYRKGPLTAKQLRVAEALVAQLLARNVVEQLPPATKKGAPRLALTATGQELARWLPPPKLTVPDVYRQLMAIQREMSALRVALGKPAEVTLAALPAAPSVVPEAPEQPAPVATATPVIVATATPVIAAATPASPPPHQPLVAEEFDRVVRTALRELDASGRHGGLVPLPSLRRALSHHGWSREQFDAALLERQRSRALDLKIANDPRAVADAGDGIDTARGLLYYVVAR